MDEGTTATLASPALDHIIERPRLISLLEEAGARVALLVAPAGYGKTTLARQWSARQTGPVAWHRTTRASGDVAALAVSLDDVLAAATDTPRRDPKRIRSIAAVNASPAPLARALVSTYAHLTRDVLLVLDEWEAAGTDEADELMAAIVDGLDIRILVTSRTRPPWCTSRLAVYGEVLEIGLEHLAMTGHEGLDVLASNRHVDKETILERARGWPAVLGLAAMSTRAKMPRDAISRTLHDFLAEELLAATPPDVVDGLLLLVASAVSEPSTARLLLGERTDTLIAEAAARGLLALDAGGTVSVHPLVRELLEIQLADGADTSTNRVVTHLKPLIAGHRWDEALAAVELLPDQDFVTQALREGIDDLLAHRGTNTLRRWVAVSRAAKVNDPLMAYVESELALRSGALDRSFMLASSAARRLQGDLAARAHLVAARAAYLEDRAGMGDPHIAEGLRLAQRQATRRTASWLRFVRTAEEEGENASAELREFALEADGEAEGLLRLAQGRLHLGLLEGGLSDQLDWAEAATSLLPDVEPPVRTSFLNAYSNALSTAGRYRKALEIADEEAALAGEYELEFVKHHALMNRVRSLVGLRRFALAQRTIHLDRASPATSGRFFHARHAIETAGVYLSIGDPQRALAALLLDPHSSSKTVRAEFLATRALAQSSCDREASLASASRAEQISRSTEVRSLVAVTRAVAALDHDHQHATTQIEAAFQSGALHGIVLGIRSCPALAQHIGSRNQQREALIQLLIETGDKSLSRRLGIALPRSPIRSQVLSPRELEIHGLIAQGLTNTEISRLLFISESTTKVHVRHIFEKLGVKSRAEAVAVWPQMEKRPD